ncbi:MAG: hypothetical protein KAT15_13800, partial [Bacteroidales bacterium]|nr:hypothetical protein [Bacteroidales bacterium]
MTITLRSSLILAGIMLGVTLFADCNSSAGSGQEKPNFVWIISEDNSKHYMELFDPNGIATPNIEK